MMNMIGRPAQSQGAGEQHTEDAVTSLSTADIIMTPLILHIAKWVFP